LIPALGRKKLKTLSAADVAGFDRSRLDSVCSAASVHKMRETLHKALRQAVRWGYMMKNPADDVDPPKSPRKKLLHSPGKRRVGS
jgi:site-specific recombinase XerD